MNFIYVFYDVCDGKENPLSGLSFASSVKELYDKINNKKSLMPNISVYSIKKDKSAVLWVDDLNSFSELALVLKENGLLSI